MIKKYKRHYEKCNKNWFKKHNYMNTSLIFSLWKTPEYWAFILLSHLLLSLFIWLDFWSVFLPPEGNHYMMMIVGQKNDVISSAFQISPKLCWFQREHVPTSDGHACVLIIGTWICEPGFWLVDINLHSCLGTTFIKNYFKRALPV